MTESTISENNKRIAKNTLLLYFRMLLTMGVSLYTVRIVLETLGIIDYGLYNVVGGIVTMFSFLSGTMAAASQRFFSFELGRGDIVRLKQIFSVTRLIYVLLSIVVLILAETVGLWFLNTQMTIPPDRTDAAHWVYQFSIFSFLMTMYATPYNAVIIAHERMNVYAWVSILEVILKLLIVYILVSVSFDKLKVYAVLIFGVTTLITLIYRIYGIRKFEECRFTFYWDRSLYKEIVSYSGWNLFGALAGVFNNQGINILLNMFFGPVVNAARGIAYQINGALNSFIQNFMVASRPQITKYYASGENKEMLQLVFRTSKFSYYLLFILSLSFLMETKSILSIWLTQIPDYTIIFTRLIILIALIDSLSYSLMAAAQATGKIKKYQSIVGGMMLLTLPVSYLFLILGERPEVVFYIGIVNSIICLFLRLFLLKNMINLSLTSYFKEVLIPILSISLVTYLSLQPIIHSMNAGIIRFIIIALSGVIVSLLLIYYIGLIPSERNYIYALLKSKLFNKILKR